MLYWIRKTLQIIRPIAINKSEIKMVVPYSATCREMIGIILTLT